MELAASRPTTAHAVSISDVLGLTWPESPGLGLNKPQARPLVWAWAWPGLGLGLGQGLSGEKGRRWGSGGKVMEKGRK